MERDGDVRREMEWGEMEGANRKRRGMRSKGNERRGNPSNVQVNKVAGVTGTHKFNCTPPKTGFCTKTLSYLKGKIQNSSTVFHLYTGTGAWTRILDRHGTDTFTD